MTFLNPLVLFGLVAAAIPVLIHLLQLKKLRQVEFSSIRFLKEIRHASARRVRLRDYLLLLLRTLAIASIVVAFSRPAIKGFLGANPKTSSVIILDDSPSTTARNEYGEISSQIRSAAVNLLNGMKAGDNAGVIFTSGLADTGSIGFSADPKMLSTRVTRSEPSSVSGNYSRAIEEALHGLNNSGFANNEIYVVGDMQEGEFAGAARHAVPANTRIFFVRTEESPNDNLSVSSVKFLNPVVEVNSPLRIEATVTNNDGSGKTGVVVSLFLDGKKVAQSVTDLPAGASRAVQLAFNVTSGGFHQGVVQIDDNSIQGDNKFNFSFYAIRKLNVLIVSSRSDDDFVLNAAQAVMDTSTVIDTRVVAPAQFTYANLAGVDVVVVESYPESAGSPQANQSFDTKLVRFVREGGGVILFAPRQDEMGSYVGLVAAMNVGTVTRLLSRTNSSFLSLASIDIADHFFSGIFSSNESADQIKSQLVTKIYSGAIIQPDPFDHILMSMTGGPFLVSREVGDGFAFVSAAGADTASSNFPLSPFFPVVIQRALFYSAAVRHKPIQVYAGQRTEFRYTAGGIRTATLVSPSGNRSEEVPRYAGATARFDFHNLTRPGTYTLVGQDTLCEISVNVDPRESNLAQSSTAEIKKYAEKIGFAGKNVYIVNADRNVSASIEKLRLGDDLSSYFAAAALIFLIAEIFVARMKTI